MDKLQAEVPMPIKTPRLMLRPPQAGDGQAVFEAKTESLEQLKQWMPWAHNEFSAEVDEAMCQTKHDAFLKRDDLMMFAFDHAGNFIGSTGIHPQNWDNGCFEIGYWVRTSEAGKGYATEITTALCHYAFKQLNAKRVQISHNAGNLASKAVIKKVGFPFEGVARKGSDMPMGDPADGWHYAFVSIDEVPPIDVSW